MLKSKIYAVITFLALLALVTTACTGQAPAPTPAPTPTPSPAPAPTPTPAPAPTPTPTPIPTPTPPAGEEANFRFLISDDVNAIEDFEHVYVTISKIGVHSAGESGNWTEFTPDVTEVDLKPLIGENALEIWSGNLTPGEYNKVFIYVSDVNGILIEALGGEEANIKLPSNKLQISKPFVISEDTVSFVYDVTVIEAGKSGQYILQPQIAQSGAGQIFREVKQEEIGKDDEPEEPEELEFEGTIETIDGTTWTVNIEGESRTVDVSEAEIEGQPDVGLHVTIEGTEEDGNILAEKVEVEAEVALEDTIWVLESYGDPENLNAVLEDTEITINFISAEVKMEGSAGCNSYFGSYEVEGNQLSIPGPIGATEMYCMEPEGIMEQEQEYLAILQDAESYEIEDDQLQIVSGDKVLVFKHE